MSIKGSNGGIEAAKQELKKLLSDIKTKVYVVKQPGMPAYFKHESAGQSQLVNIENRCQVGAIRHYCVSKCLEKSSTETMCLSAYSV